MPGEPAAVLRAFETDPGDRFVGEWPLAGATLDELRTLFSAEADDPMYGSFPVEASHVSKLQCWTDHHIDVAKLDYFVDPA